MPLQGKYLSKQDIINLVDSLLSGYWSVDEHFLGVADEHLYLPSLQEIEAIMNDPRTHVDGYPNAGERFDCDDFSFAFKGKVCLFGRDILDLETSICVGIGWGGFTWMPGFHACNWVLLSNERLRWIEPQSRTHYERSRCRKRTVDLIIA